MTEKSDYEKVREFTLDPSLTHDPTPRALNKEEVRFLLGMCVSELVEMAQTVTDTPEEAMKMITDSVSSDLTRNYEKPRSEIGIMAEQADAAVDCWYYLLNGFCKKNINPSRVFNVVHNANMAKKFPDGTFHRREDGKIIKPPNWEEPNIEKEIIEQVLESDRSQ